MAPLHSSSFKRSSRRGVMRQLTGLGLVVAGVPLLAGCDQNGPAVSHAPPQSGARVFGWMADGGPVRLTTSEPWTGPVPPSTQRFLDRLAELGYVTGQNLLRELRAAPTPDLLTAAAAELVALRVELIVTLASPRATRAAFDTPGNTPVVMAAGSNDPVADGYAQSLGRPGGKLTGVMYSRPGEFTPKRLELLKEALPSLTRLGMLFDTGIDIKITKEVSAAENAPIARDLGFELIYVEVSTESELEGAVATLAAAGVQAIYPSTRSAWTGVDMMARLSQVALRHGLPIMGLNWLSAQAGALIGYAPDSFVLWARAADYVDKILRGARPADLPIEQATHYELSLNLRTAETLGLTIPPTVINRAAQVFR